MKICFAASSGGHYEQLMMLKPLMEEYDSFVVTEQTDYIPTYIEASGIKKIAYFIRAYMNIEKAMRTNKPDIVHIHMSYRGSFYRKYEVVHAHVLPAEGVFIVKRLVPPMLACQIGRHIGAARRNADAEIEAEVLLQAAVQHASAVNAPQAATHIDDTVFHGLFLHRLIPFPSQYNGTAGNTH